MHSNLLLSTAWCPTHERTRTPEISILIIWRQNYRVSTCVTNMCDIAYRICTRSGERLYVHAAGNTYMYTQRGTPICTRSGERLHVAYVLCPPTQKIILEIWPDQCSAASYPLVQSATVCVRLLHLPVVDITFCCGGTHWWVARAQGYI